jgi:hypothetical protein
MVMGERASASTSPVLELRGVSKSFQGTKEGTLQTLIPIVVGRHWPRCPCIRQLSRRRKRFSRQPG